MELTKEEREVYNFMQYSRLINGITIVHPNMLQAAKEVERKLSQKGKENEYKIHT